MLWFSSFKLKKHVYTYTHYLKTDTNELKLFFFCKLTNQYHTWKWSTKLAHQHCRHLVIYFIHSLSLKKFLPYNVQHVEQALKKLSFWWKLEDHSGIQYCKMCSVDPWMSLFIDKLKTMYSTQLTVKQKTVNTDGMFEYS